MRHAVNLLEGIGISVVYVVGTKYGIDSCWAFVAVAVLAFGAVSLTDKYIR